MNLMNLMKRFTGQTGVFEKICTAGGMGAYFFSGEGSKWQFQVHKGSFASLICIESVELCV